MLPFTYQTRTHTRARHLKITVDSRGQVIVTVPKRIRENLIEEFLVQNQAWVLATLAKVQQRPTYGENDQEVYLFGKKYDKKVEVSQDTLPGVHIRGPLLLINPTGENISALVTRFLKNTATNYIIPRTHQLAEKMGITFKEITLRQQKTRWGSCTSEGNLNFNWRLVHAPAAVIDYVIIHELAHRKHMDHSDRFWALVAKYDPAHQQHRGWLKRHGMAVG